jgi:hypothetical protein
MIARATTAIIPEHVYVSLPSDLVPIALTITDEFCDLQMGGFYLEVEHL